MAGATLGSPPHTRGKVVKKIRHPIQNRITPAYTGKRRVEHMKKMATKDHPRIHGEKKLQGRHFHFHLGSPPHTRGKAEFVVTNREANRITPAYTGKR